MKITLLLGRGIEGAGNTQFAKMFYKGLKALNHQVDLIASSKIKAKTFRKTKIMDDNIDIFFYSNQPVDIPESDLLYILSVPDKKAPTENTEVFNSIITNCKGKKVYVMVDHLAPSLYRNYYYKKEGQFFNNVDLILTHPEAGETDVLKYLTKIGQIDKQYDVGLNLIMHDFDYLNKFKDTNQVNTVLFSGRTAKWKGIYEFIDLFNDFNDSFDLFAMQGLERSMAYHAYFNLTGKADYLDYKKTLDVTNVDNSIIHVTGVYIQEEGLKRMAKCKYGAFFSHIKPCVDFAGPLENTFLEMVGVGTTPIVLDTIKDVIIADGIRVGDLDLTFYNPKYKKVYKNTSGLSTYDVVTKTYDYRSFSKRIVDLTPK